MIQRIQSLYLLLTSVLSLLFLNGRFLNFFNSSGSEIYMNFMGIWKSSTEGNPQIITSLIPFSVIILVICILSFSAIFVYKNRTIQLKMTAAVIFLTLVVIGLTVYFAVTITGKYQVEIVPSLKMFLPVLMLSLGIMAYAGIKKDEKLVKSYDRLR